MEQDKRKLIVSEIEHWRQSRLLPEQYCDFLLNLYLEVHQERSKSVVGLSTAAIKNSSPRQWFTIFSIIGFISFIAIHFTTFSFQMQTGISILFVSLLFWIGTVQREKRPVVSYFSFGAGSVLMLVSGLYLLDGKGWSGLAAVIFVGLCSFIWIFIGIAQRIALFHFCGWAVLFLIYAWVLRQNIDTFDWAGLQLSWVPLSIVLGWLGWLFQHVNKPVGAVLLCVSVLGWFAPEIYGMALTSFSFEWLQWSLMGKIILSGAGLFMTRKKWIEWVA